MSPSKKSLRAQVVSWLMILFGILLVISFAVSYVAARDFANLPYDHQLLATARTLVSHVRVENGQPRLDLPDTLRDSLLFDEDDKVTYRLTTGEGLILGGDPGLPLIEEDSQTHHDLVTTEVAGLPMRIASIQTSLPELAGTVRITTQVAETLNKRDRLARQIFFKLLIPQIILAALPIGGLWLGLGSGLVPLERLKRALTARSPYDLSPVNIEDDTPDEVRPLIEAFNEILSRMRDLLDARQRFVADAAHQLRTPLAGLKTQAELALRLQDPKDVRNALQQVLAAAERGSNLASQLLTLARHEQGMHDAVAIEPVDLNAIVQSAATQYVDAAMKKGVDLGFEPSTRPVIISADPVSMREMVGNLIDNAVRYTQQGGRVTARVSAETRSGLVTVEDNGPGIPPAERARVFERFYRGLGSNEEGSGLGLAIVQEIARRHSAEVSFAEGPGGRGTTFSINLPALTAADTTDW